MKGVKCGKNDIKMMGVIVKESQMRLNIDKMGEFFIIYDFWNFYYLCN